MKAAARGAREDSKADSGGAASHEWIDHTSEITLRLRAGSFPALLAEAARAFAALAPEHLGGEDEERWRTFSLPGGDRISTLVDWLNELVFLAETESWVPSRVEPEARPTDAEGCVRLRARGRRLREPFVLVKAATLHGADVHEQPGERFEAEVTLDV